MGVSLTGGENLERFIKANTKIGTEVIEVVKRNGAEMQQRAQRYAPVNTGFLKRNIFLNFVNSGMEFMAEVSGDADYDPYQEYGTRFMSSKPHIRPAFFIQRAKFAVEIDRLVERKR